MVTLDRWERAQEYEAGFWEGVARRIAQEERDQLNWYRWRSDRLRERLGSVGLASLTDGSARVLEVGSGPVGVAAFFPGEVRAAIDPLEHFYSANPVLTELRDPDVGYREGVGEKLPYGANTFDLLIIENCIDHVSDVQAVMNEIVRVLESDGVLYLTVNCRTWWGFWMHRLLSRFRIDPGHPHTFTTRRIRSLVEEFGFEILQFEAESYWKAWWKYLTSGDLADSVQAALGVSHFTVSLVARHRGP